ncbi:MAG: histidinol-phosphatase HisJ family protein [Anaerovoracaceae bacterium]|nr:histidinol-phosphatase HisJ family protein [Anaerovoracaceae bacterium]
MYDYHTHTSFSQDSNALMPDMLDAAVERGVREIAVTDHCDPDFPDPVWTFSLDFDNYFDALLENEEKYRDRIKVVKGIEIGIQPGGTIRKCEEAARMFDYDVVIGSIHAFNGYDLDKRDFTGMEQDEIIPAFYEQMYKCIDEFKDFDIIAHFNIIDRYIDFTPDYSRAEDVIAEILKIAIKEDKSIELNTSSYRYGMGERTHASRGILELYRDLGGKNVTFGSDAHFPEHIGWEYEKARGILRSLGFEKLSVYDRRTRSEVPL